MTNTKGSDMAKTELEASWDRIHELMRAENDCACDECVEKQKTETGRHAVSGEELG